MTVGEVAKLAGISIRTLRYYDEIGLLKPSAITDAGYRVYDDADLETLQQILFFRELDFSLEDIRNIMRNPEYSKEEALRKQRELLLKKRDRINRLVALVDKTLEGDQDMSFEQFDTLEIEKLRREYAQEAKERWGGSAAYAEYEKKSAQRSNDHQELMTGEAAEILHEFGQNRLLAPDSPQAQALVQKWQGYITANYYTCTKEILSCLGQMYVADERFTRNIDQHGAGTAAFMSAAIEAYCHDTKE